MRIKRRAPSAERRAPSAERRAPSAERRALQDDAIVICGVDEKSPLSVAFRLGACS
jgi:hypothetical protein